MVVTAPDRSRRGGSLKLLLLVAIGAAAIICVAAGSVFIALSNSDATQTALERANASPTLTNRIGTPVQRGWIVTGSIKVRGSSGNVDVAVPVSGPKGGATVYARGRKEAGLWIYDLIEAAPDDGSERIDLLKSEPR